MHTLCAKMFWMYVLSAMMLWYTIVCENFMLKIIRMKIFRVDISSQFIQSTKLFLTIDGYNMDKCLECS